MFSEVMADCVIILLLRLEYTSRETMLGLIRNDNIKVAVVELRRRDERMGACITTLRGQARITKTEVKGGQHGGGKRKKGRSDGL